MDESATPRPPHMTPDEFRALGHRMVDLVADYMRTVERLPVLSKDVPGDVLARLPEHPPERGLDAGAWDEVFRDVQAAIVPGVTHWQHPSFFGYFPCNASGPGILGELLSAGLGIQGMLWQTSPACTELETRMLDWCAELFGLPDCFRSTADNDGLGGGGVIQGTASEAALVALVAARQKWRRLRAQRTPPAPDAEVGLAESAIEKPFAVIASEAAHSSIAKAAMVAGLADGPEDDDRLWSVPTDARGAMDLGALRAVLDERLGLPGAPAPLAVVATVGTTGVGAVDPIADLVRTLDEAWLAAMGRPFDAWLHVDAAWAGSALVCPEHRAMIAGVERADSITVNPHKWLLTNFDCNLFWTRARRDLTDAMSVTPEYLRNAASESGGVIDYRDWQVPLGRRFRALKLWFVIRHYGAEGLRAHVREHCRIAALFERWLGRDSRFEVPVPRSLGLVCFRLRGDDRATRDLLDRVNATGRAFLTHTTFAAPGSPARPLARMAIGATATEERHVREAWRLIQSTADGITLP